MAKQGQQTEAPATANQLPALAGPRLAYHPGIQDRFGIDKTEWKALVEAIFPNAASTESVILALSYCKARRLDPFKRCVHIVPIWNSEKKCLVDTIWPGIGELRTTAFRTGEYAGREPTECGPDIKQKVGTETITFPEWSQVTVHRLIRGIRVAFAGPKVYWLETYATRRRDDDTPNEMWLTRPRGQLCKCAEAAALRAAFPEEIGSDYIPEEVEHRTRGPATNVIDEVKRPAIDQLTDRITGTNGVNAGDSIQDNPKNAVDPDAVTREQIRSKFELCVDGDEAKSFYNRYCGPESTLSPELTDYASGQYDEALKRIARRAAEGEQSQQDQTAKGKGTQRQLMPVHENAGV